MILSVDEANCEQLDDIICGRS